MTQSTKILKNGKIRSQKYWSEGSYKSDGNNKSYRELEITKRGCEFLAHKTTGTKGSLFTDRYMDAFESMKETINHGIPEKKSDRIEIMIMNAKTRVANTRSEENSYGNFTERNVLAQEVLPPSKET